MSKHLSIKHFAHDAIDEIELIASEMGYKFDENDNPIPVGRESANPNNIYPYPPNIQTLKSPQKFSKPK